MEIRLSDVARPPDHRADLAACRATLAQGSKTFMAASFLLPRAVREPAAALYAFCRMADDAVDGHPDPADAVVRLRARLADIYAGRPQPAIEDRAMAAVVHHYGIPQTWPAALIEGFQWDAEGRRYETIEDLHAYAARVAGAVGAMMALVMGARTPSALARACDLGVAMQLSNIARDVGEDAALGRLYLPRRWMREAGLDPDRWLESPGFSSALAGVVERLLREADGLYRRAGHGVAELPLACRPGINAARLLYRQIGLEVERRGLDSVSGRAVVSTRRKVVGLVHAACLLRPSRPRNVLPTLPANEFLVEAMGPSRAHAAPAAVGTGGVAWWHVRTRVIRTIDLFEQLERRDRHRGRVGRAGPLPGLPTG